MRQIIPHKKTIYLIFVDLFLDLFLSLFGYIYDLKLGNQNKNENAGLVENLWEI